MLGLSELLILFQEKQSNPNARVTHTDEYHKCSTCDTEFQGRYCPQCGMDATETRFSIKAVWNHFISVFDFADRSIPRTLLDLIYRPGYMISDYLNGRRRLYFPPIRLLIVMALFSAIIIKLLQYFGYEVHTESVGEIFNGRTALWEFASEQQKEILGMVNRIIEWGDENVAYGLMAQSLFWIVSLWLAMKMFSKKFARKYNLAEVFMAEMYVLSQLQMFTIVYMCLHAVFCPSSVVTASLPFLIGFLLRFYDYWQLYRRGVWGTLWRMGVASLIIVVIVLVISIAFILLLFCFG